MNKEEFDHGIRAAGGVLGISELLVIGSQAAHASIQGDLPPEAQRSVEVDIAAFEDTDGSLADQLDGAIGEASRFHQSFDFYVDGVSTSTAWSPGVLTCMISGFPRRLHADPRTSNSAGRSSSGGSWTGAPYATG